MRHFAGMDTVDALFARRPVDFTAHSPRDLLGVALGATLYSPATRAGVAQNLMARRWPGLTTMVLCLEDAIGDRELPEAEQILQQQLTELEAAYSNGTVAPEDLPLLFVRVRSPQHLRDWCRRIGGLRDVLAGFALPKFNSGNAADYLEAAVESAERAWLMPILESPEIAHVETRAQELLSVSSAMAPLRHRIPAVRVGATDLASVWGLRRRIEHTVYDISVIRAALADIVNVMGRAENGWAISGPVWEYFSAEQRLLKSQLRESVFEDELGTSAGAALRGRMVSSALDGLVKEVLLDHANGMIGKTVIHPSHVAVVNALCAVSEEEYDDAQTVLSQLTNGAGATGSAHQGKMNEPKPHAAWASRILLRAQAYGVLKPDASWVRMIDALDAAHNERAAG